MASRSGPLGSRWSNLIHSRLLARWADCLIKHITEATSWYSNPRIMLFIKFLTAVYISVATAISFPCNPVLHAMSLPMTEHMVGLKRRKPMQAI